MAKSNGEIAVHVGFVNFFCTAAVHETAVKKIFVTNFPFFNRYLPPTAAYPHPLNSQKSAKRDKSFCRCSLI